MGSLIRIDSWASALTTLGTSFDKFRSYKLIRPAVLDTEACSVLYHHNPLARKICEIFPEDAMREGVCAKDDEGATLEAVESRLTELGASEALTFAAIWGNVYGWGACYIGVDDGLTQDQPLDPARVTKVNFLRVVDRRDVAPRDWYNDPLHPKFQQPQTFTFTQAGDNGKPVSGVRIHESRFIAFDGARTGVREQRANGGFPHSKLQAVQEQLLRVGVSWDNAAQLLQVVSQTVMKIKGLQHALVSDKGAEALEKRAQLVDMARGITRSLWIDADGEEVMNLSTPLTGVSDVLDRLGAMLAASTGIPVTKLFGTQPTGLAATGAADERSWNNRVESYREQEMLPAFDVLVSCLASELGEKGDINVVFPSLDRPTDAETAEIRLKVAQADQIYTTIQAVLPEEIAVSRFGGPNYSIDTHLKPGPRNELEFPAPPGSDSGELDSNAPDNEGAARQDGFDPSQPRGPDGKWSASASAAAAKVAHAAAWKNYQRDRSPINKASLDKAVTKLKQRKALDRKVNAEGREKLRLDKPKLNAAERKALIAPHREELKAAAAEHAEKPTHETSARLQRAVENMRAARQTAGSAHGVAYKPARQIVEHHVQTFEREHTVERLHERMHSEYNEGRKSAATGAHHYKAETIADAHDYAMENALSVGWDVSDTAAEMRENIRGDFDTHTTGAKFKDYSAAVTQSVKAAKTNIRAAKAAFKAQMKNHPDRKNNKPL